MPNSCAGELVLVPGVGKVAIGGVIPQQINVDISLAKMAARGITLNQLAAILTRLNVVSSAGEIRVGSESIRLHPTGEFQSIDELGDLLVSPSRRQRHHPTAGYCYAVARANRLAGQYLSCQRAPGGDHGSFFYPWRQRY